MREIKFKVWNRNTKEMVDLHKITPLALSDTLQSEMTLKGIGGLFIPFSPDLILMQFTGLHDKNGNPIWEGDIVKRIGDFGTEQYPDEKELIEEVEYRGGCFYPVCEEPSENFEVIGNIHEHPELLK